ncbi:MAG TPA: hypothetical protein VHP58_00395 [Alphaproteobacteria bacterium]|nr:hypothetical protein [Alphaproteobacteria bacterium]
MQLDILCADFAQLVPDCLKSLPHQHLGAELSHARLRLNTGSDAQAFWVNLPAQPGPLLRVAHKVADARPGKTQSIFWGMLQKGTPLYKVGVNWIEITPPNAAHQTGFDALVFKSQPNHEAALPNGITLRFQERNVRDILSTFPRV